jgi:hypothetical protein
MMGTTKDEVVETDTSVKAVGTAVPAEEQIAQPGVEKDWKAEHDHLSVQIESLAALILENDLIGEGDNGGACEIAGQIMLRQSAALAAVVDAKDKADTADLLIADINAALVSADVMGDEGDTKAALTALIASRAELQDEITALKDKSAQASSDAGAQEAHVPAVAATIKAPKPGKVLKLPEEGARAKADAVAADLDGGAALGLVLTDDDGRVQPFPAQVGGRDIFLLTGGPGEARILFGPPLSLGADLPPCTVRHAVLIDESGGVLSSCRFSADLIGGNGFSALIPGNNIQLALT